MSRDFPPPPSTEKQARLATDELIATAHALISLEAPTLSPEALHGWLHSPEELPLNSTDDGSPNGGTPKT